MRSVFVTVTVSGRVPFRSVFAAEDALPGSNVLKIEDRIRHEMSGLTEYMFSLYCLFCSNAPQSSHSLSHRILMCLRSY